MTITITAFERSPDGGKGLAREEGDLALFETGAIVFYIAERHAGLLLDDANARARAITWMFAALNTVEPPILERETARLLEGDKTWTKERLPLVEDRVRGRLDQLSGRLGDADWLDGALMMVSVLLRLRLSGLWTSIRTWLLMSPAAKHAPPTSGLSPLNWRLTPPSHQPAD
jgi:glutathione S-transferase